MADGDRNAFEDGLIEDMRSHGGAVTDGPLAGHPLLVMTSQGARTGQPRRAILTFFRDGDDYIVAGTASGSPTDPTWLHNLRTHPEVSVEADNRQFEARATLVNDADRARLWDQHVAALPHFADYPAQAGRVIPVVRLTPTIGDR